MQSTLKTLSIGLVMTGSLFIGNVATAADDGKALYTAKLCMTCHGAKGNVPIMPLYPKITGQSDVYLLQQMKDIRDGKRTNGMSAAMKALTAKVTDDEFKAIAKWLASLKSK
ncbi:MAG: cytochrome c [Thiomargarita sp.]|nr:cytochrome c [Thiomargarita sp.]